MSVQCRWHWHWHQQPIRWLLEINASPSLVASSQEDYELKCRLLDDVLNVVDLENRSVFFWFGSWAFFDAARQWLVSCYKMLLPTMQWHITSFICYLRSLSSRMFSCRLLGNERRVGGFDLIWDDGPIYVETTFGEETQKYNSYLGCNTLIFHISPYFI